MEYFSNFPKVSFNNELVKNITIRLDFIKNIKNNAALFEYIQIRDGERPEDIAFLVYGDPDLYWVILFINDIVDPYFDWPLTSNQLLNHLAKKYGDENVYNVHHYETTSQSDLGPGIWVNQGTVFSESVSNFDHESNLNEAKRKIKLLKPEYIAQVITEYKNELR